MGYGSHARRVPAKGSSSLTDADLYKVALLCKTERGLVDSDSYPVVHSEIYSMDDFYKKCGGFNSSYYGAYVAQSFYDELDSGINCEMKVLSPVASDATQATYTILDSAGSSIYTIRAGRKGVYNDKSAFGNKTGIKIAQVSELTMNITSALTAADTSAILNNVDNLKVGYYIQITDGTNTEVKVITGVTTSTKTITFSAITNSYAISSTTITRLDWSLQVGVKDSLGNYQKIEDTWEGPFAVSNTLGVASLVNDSTDGSDYVILSATTSNSSTAANKIPAILTSWTPLTGGADGTTFSDSTWKTMATTYLTSTDFTFLLAPESASTTHNANMLDFATDDYKGMYYAQAANGASEDTLKNFGATLRGGIKFGMIPSDKWIQVNDPTTDGGIKEIPMSGIAAAFWFNTYTKYGEAKVAAGNKSEMVLNASGKLLDSNGLVHDDREGKGGRLIRQYSVNIARYTRGKGITINSARTFSTDDGYKYQNQIMQWLLYSRSIVNYLKTIEQDPSGSAAQETHRLVVWSYMKAKYNKGYFFVGKRDDGTKTTFNDVVVIVNDFTINTLANINNGIEEMFLQFVAPCVIEEPILSLASAGVTSVSG